MAQRSDSSPVATTACVPPPEYSLEAKLTLWQQRLKVDDWKITIVMSHANELKPETLGNIYWDADKKTAVIHVLSSEDYDLPCESQRADQEFTVVHELIHLVLSTLPRSQASRRNEEHAVNQLTEALLALDRPQPKAGVTGRPNSFSAAPR